MANHEWELMDTAAFEHMMRWAKMMAVAGVLPDHLKVFRRVDDNSLIARMDKEPTSTRFFIDVEATTASCALVVTQAAQWRIHPFQLAQVSFMARGKLAYEGKLIQAVMERELMEAWREADATKAYFQVDYEGEGENLKATITACRPGDPTPVSVVGKLKDWATRNKEGELTPQWKGDPGKQRKMMRYRGVREWAREYLPGLMLGVLSNDELDDMMEDYAARKAIPVNAIPSATPTIEHKPVESVIPQSPIGAPPVEAMAQRPTAEVDKKGFVTKAGFLPSAWDEPKPGYVQMVDAPRPFEGGHVVDPDGRNSWGPRWGEPKPGSTFVNVGGYAIGGDGGPGNDLPEHFNVPEEPQPDENRMMGEEVRGEVASWVARMRKITTLDELIDFNEHTIAPFLAEYPDAPKELVDEARQTFEGRRKILAKAKKP